MTDRLAYRVIAALGSLPRGPQDSRDPSPFGRGNRPGAEVTQPSPAT